MQLHFHDLAVAARERIVPLMFWGVDGVQIENAVGAFKGIQKIDTVYAMNCNLPREERYRAENMMVCGAPNCSVHYDGVQVVSICFSRVVAEEHAWHVLGGDPDNPNCSSLGGALRRMWPGTEFDGEVDSLEAVCTTYTTLCPR